MDKQTLIFVFLLGVFLVLSLKEVFQRLREEIDEHARLGANDCS
jgi:hypothetical protein